MPSMVFVLVVAIAVVGLVLRLLRSRKLREKYAALWIVVGLATVVLVAFPGLLDRAALLLGFVVPSNLLFLLAIALLLGVTLQLSHEISILEDETRVLAEESAIHRLSIRQLTTRLTALERGRAGGSTAVREHDPRQASDAEHVAHQRAQ